MSAGHLFTGHASKIKCRMYSTLDAALGISLGCFAQTKVLLCIRRRGGILVDDSRGGSARVRELDTCPGNLMASITALVFPETPGI